MSKDDEIGIYRERAYLISYLSKRYDCSLECATDCKTPEFNWIIYVDTPEGQLSWHICDDDLDLFTHVERNKGREWDGHTTFYKYQMVGKLK